MKRPGTRQNYERLLNRIRTRVPDVSLRTTFIVGFPGETDEDVAELSSFVEDQAFDHVGVFTYSHEEGTTAHLFTDDVPADEKEARRNWIMGRQQELAARRQQAMIGRVVRVLVDGPSADHELVVKARLRSQAPDIDGSVFLTECDPSDFPPGRFVDVEIVDSLEYDLVGRPMSAVSQPA
jgi:ribosomal protein S12 methylthiotransferase